MRFRRTKSSHHCRAFRALVVSRRVWHARIVCKQLLCAPRQGHLRTKDSEQSGCSRVAGSIAHEPGTAPLACAFRGASICTPPRLSSSAANASTRSVGGSKPPFGGAAPSPRSRYFECQLPTSQLGWGAAAANVGCPPRLPIEPMNASYDQARSRQLENPAFVSL